MAAILSWPQCHNDSIMHRSRRRNIETERSFSLSALIAVKKSSDEHEDVIKWKHFPCYWPFVRGIHRFPVNSPHKDQLRGALMFSLICTRINGWVNNGECGDLKRRRAHYDVIVTSFVKMKIFLFQSHVYTSHPMNNAHGSTSVVFCAPSQCKDGLSRCGYFHYKDKTVVRRLIFIMGILY